MKVLIVLGILPIVLAVLSLLIRNAPRLRLFVAVMHWVQLALSIWLLLPLLDGTVPAVVYSPGLMLDRLGAMFVILTVFVIASASTHAVCYFAEEDIHRHSEIPSSPMRNGVFYACLNIFMLAMMGVYFCDNLAYLWMCIEATTLSSAALVFHDRTKNALEATWKYLIICSVGIALALFGTVLVFTSSQRGAFPEGSLNVSELILRANKLDFVLLRLGFFFCLIGYGTKAGIFPMHSWLPDAHSEAPAPASAVLSGALLNCALYGIWRVYQVILAASPHGFVNHVVPILGTVTVVAASIFLVRQYSFKRMLAYSSIENVGLMLVAIGLGSGPLFFLQAVNHSCAKVALFLLSGNITAACGTKRLNKLHGILKTTPLWGGLLALATFAVTGAPPFGAFVSETAILITSANRNHWPLAVLLISAIAVSFIALCLHIGRILVGQAKPDCHPFQPMRSSIVPGVLVVGVLALGVLLRLDTLVKLP